METELARTFLIVVAAGNFISAADRLHVTQSTVSACIRTLEEQLACTLFVRNRAGTVLTPAGTQFQKHAASLVRTVEQAPQDVGIPMGYRAVLAVGGRIGLWENLLLAMGESLRRTGVSVDGMARPTAAGSPAVPNRGLFSLDAGRCSRPAPQLRHGSGRQRPDPPARPDKHLSTWARMTKGSIK